MQKIIFLLLLLLTFREEIVHIECVTPQVEADAIDEHAVVRYHVTHAAVPPGENVIVDLCRHLDG